MNLDLARIFEAAPARLLVLAPDGPRFTIFAVTDAYLQATKTQRATVLGRGVFEVFPDNPDDPETKAVDFARASFQRVVDLRRTDVMGIRRHDIRRPEAEGGGFEERLWEAVNFPVLGADGQVACIIHRVEDVTESTRLKRGAVEQEAANVALRASRKAAVNLIEDALEARRQAEQVCDALLRESAEHKETEAKLRQSEAMRDIAEDVGRVGSWQWDISSRHSTWSQGMYRLFDVDPGDFDGDVTPILDERVHPDDRAAIDEATAQAAAGQYTPVEYRVIWRDGTEHVLHGEGAIEHNADGTPVAITGYYQDVTERRQAEDALRESGAKLEAALASMSDAVFISDTEGRFIHFNDAFATFHRFRSKAECATTLAEYPDFVDVFMAEGGLAPLDQWAVPRALRGEAVTNAEYTVRRKDTGETWVGSYSFGPIRDRKGEIVGSVVVARDVTERKRAEEALRESEERFRLLAASTPDSASVQDRDLRYEWVVNPALGLSPEDFIGKTDRDLVGAEQFEAVRALKQGVMDSGEALHVEVPLTDAKGRMSFWDGAYVPRRDRDGAVTGVLSYFTDITERKQAEDEIRHLNAELEERVVERTAKLETANRELEAFSYTVSHDLRAPLRAISGFASILARRYRDDLDEKGRHYVDTIAASGERMGILIEELLDYARLGRGSVRAEPVPLGPLVTGLRVTFGERIAAAGGTLEVIEPLATPVADATLLERILANLVGNALTYRRPDVVPRVTLKATRQGRTVTLAVADNGIGIPAEYREKIFEVFARLHGDDAYEGTGIGLAIVRKAARLMGSDVTLESTEGQGSTFSLELPAAGKRSSSEP